MSRTDARRIAVQAQLLARPRPGGLGAVVRGVSLVQLEPTAAIAPSADLVLWSRLGAAYDPTHLRAALDEQRLVEIGGFVRPLEDVVLLQAEMAVWPGPEPRRAWQVELAEWLGANDASRREVLALLRSDGPLPASELPDTCARPWRSSGWNDSRNLRMLLEVLVRRGEVAVAGYEGRERLWDLAERVYPEVPVPPLAEARRERAVRRLASLGIARPGGPQDPGEPIDLRDVGEPAVVEGLRGSWRVDPSWIGRPFAGRTALLSPFDRLIKDRRRLSEVFDFDYLLEMYKPAAQRRWGYYALPVLHGDRLVGKLDAQADRDTGVLRVQALHRDVPFTATMDAAVEAEVAALAGWLGLEVEGPG
nr:crosslink repair DNA glycosylase YcaQ family protein [Nocardioides sp. zg-DK7169]